MQPATGQALPQVAMPARVISANGVAVARDIPFAILFYLTTAGLVAAAALLPMPAMEGEDVRMQDTGGGKEGTADAMTGLAVPMAAAAVGTVFGTSICAGAWLLIMRACARNLVVAALVIPVVLSGALTLWCAGRLAVGGFDSPDGPGGVLLLGGAGLLFTLVNLCWLRGMWHKVPATSLALSLSSHVVFRLPLTMVVAAKVVVLQVAWASLTLLAAVKLLGALVATGAGAEGGGGGWGEGEGGEGEGVGGLCTAAALGLLVALYWGLMVLANVGYVTTCGSVASWYFERASAERGCCCYRPVVVESLGRALTSSFGSICAGSLLVAIVQAIGTLLKYIELKAQEDGNLVFVLVACCFRCIFAVIEDLVSMFNEWAYVFVAMYGTGFATAGRAVWRLVHEQGLAAILSGLVADTVVSYGVALATVGGAAAATAVAAPTGLPPMARAGALSASALLALLLSATCLSPVRAAMRTVLVCFAEAPNALHGVAPYGAELVDAFKALQVSASGAGAPPTAVGVPVGAAAARQAGYQQLVAP